MKIVYFAYETLSMKHIFLSHLDVTFSKFSQQFIFKVLKRLWFFMRTFPAPLAPLGFSRILWKICCLTSQCQMLRHIASQSSEDKISYLISWWLFGYIYWVIRSDFLSMDLILISKYSNICCLNLCLCRSQTTRSVYDRGHCQENSWMI